MNSFRAHKRHLEYELGNLPSQMKSLRKKCKDKPDASVEAIGKLQTQVQNLTASYKALLDKEQTLVESLT